jgi:hypothetical protein
MSLIPVFEIGVWNAWIFVVAGLLLHIVPPTLATRFNRTLNKKFSEAPKDVYVNKNERRINVISVAFLFCPLCLYRVLTTATRDILVLCWSCHFLTSRDCVSNHYIALGCYPG